MKFLKNSTEHSLFNDDSIQLNETLPEGFYILKYNKPRGFYLEESMSFNVPKEIYGNTISQMNRIINTYNDRKVKNVNTGVMLEGKKGTGKSLLMKMVCIELSKSIPIISITQNFSGEEFTSFISSITQEACFVFDEFEKFYNSSNSPNTIDDEQQGNDASLLSLLDGTFSSNKLFLMTVNDIWSVGKFLKNRPGRIYYRFSFGDLESDFIREYCQKNLLNKDWIDSIIKISLVTSGMTFDILQAIVEESNRYNESPTEVVKYINAMRDGESFNGDYIIEAYDNGKLVYENRKNSIGNENFLTSVINGHAYDDTISKNGFDKKYSKTDDNSSLFYFNDDDFIFTLSPKQIERIDNEGSICYNYLHYKLIIKQIKKATYTYEAF